MTAVANGPKLVPNAALFQGQAEGCAAAIADSSVARINPTEGTNQKRAADQCGGTTSASQAMVRFSAADESTVRMQLATATKLCDKAAKKIQNTMSSTSYASSVHPIAAGSLASSLAGAAKAIEALNSGPLAQGVPPSLTADVQRAKLAHVQLMKVLGSSNLLQRYAELQIEGGKYSGGSNVLVTLLGKIAELNKSGQKSKGKAILANLERLHDAGPALIGLGLGGERPSTRARLEAAFVVPNGGSHADAQALEQAAITERVGIIADAIGEPELATRAMFEAAEALVQTEHPHRPSSVVALIRLGDNLAARDMPSMAHRAYEAAKLVIDQTAEDRSIPVSRLPESYRVLGAAIDRAVARNASIPIMTESFETELRGLPAEPTANKRSTADGFPWSRLKNIERDLQLDSRKVIEVGWG